MLSKEGLNAAPLGRGPRRATGEDGEAVAIPQRGIAAYESAGKGCKVALPFAPPAGKKPVELWLR